MCSSEHLRCNHGAWSGIVVCDVVARVSLGVQCYFSCLIRLWSEGEGDRNEGARYIARGQRGTRRRAGRGKEFKEVALLLFSRALRRWFVLQIPIRNSLWGRHVVNSRQGNGSRQGAKRDGTRRALDATRQDAPRHTPCFSPRPADMHDSRPP